MGADLFGFTVTNFIWDNSNSYKLSKENVRTLEGIKNIFVSCLHQEDPNQVSNFLSYWYTYWHWEPGKGFFFSLEKVIKLRISVSSRKKLNWKVNVTSQNINFWQIQNFFGFVISPKSAITHTLDPSATEKYFSCLVPPISFKLRPQKSTIFSDCAFPLLTASTVECQIHTAGVLCLLLIAVMI